MGAMHTGKLNRIIRPARCLHCVLLFVYLVCDFRKQPMRNQAHLNARMQCPDGLKGVHTVAEPSRASNAAVPLNVTDSMKCAKSGYPPMQTRELQCEGVIHTQCLASMAVRQPGSVPE